MSIIVSIKGTLTAIKENNRKNVMFLFKMNIFTIFFFFYTLYI